MPSLRPGFEYDVFISYRQNDNRSGWVTAFVEHLREELGAVFKNPINIYFDENPQDGILESHHVHKSVEGKLKCLIFIPILSRTYCDSKSFAWTNEFSAFNQAARADSLGLHVRLANGNVASRILPVRVHDLDETDKQAFEQECGEVLRPIDFVYRSHGVNRAITPEDSRSENQNKIVYRDQINKLAHAIGETLSAISRPTGMPAVESRAETAEAVTGRSASFWSEVRRRNVPRAGITYIVVALAIRQMAAIVFPWFNIGADTGELLDWLLIGLLPIAILLAWLYEVSPDGWVRTNTRSSSENPYSPSQKKPLTSVGVVLTLVILLAAQYYYFTITRADSRKSIAVLNFVDQTGDRRFEYVADAITNDIIDRLCIIRDLRVISPLSTSTYRNSQASIGTIAGELDVAFILTGTVSRDNDLINVSVKLTNGNDGTIMWTNSYRTKPTELLEIQSDIVLRIANVLKLGLGDSEVARLKRDPTKDFTAWDYYQRGRKLYFYYNADSNDVAIEHFKKAISIDPKYSLAWSGLADAYSQLHFRAARGIQWLDSSIVACNKALTLDSNSAEAYKALSSFYFYTKRYDTAFFLLQKAAAKNPKFVPAVYNLATNYLVRGNLVNALTLTKQAASLSPRQAFPFQLAGWTQRLLGNYQQAESWLKSALERNPTLWEAYRELGFTYCALGQEKEASQMVDDMLKLGTRDTRTLEIAGRIAHFARANSVAKELFLESIEKNNSYNTDANSVSSIGLGALFLEEGDKVQSEVYLTHALNLNLEQYEKGLKEKGLKDDDPPFNIAAIYAIQGKKEQSLQWLQTAIQYNWLDVVVVEKGPYFTIFRDDDDFRKALAPVHTRIDSMRRLASD